MILGQTNRVAISTPAAANPAFRPSLPHTGFYSHFHPLSLVTHRMSASHQVYRPPLPGPMGPGPAPTVPAPVPAAPAVGPTVPSPGGTAGFAGAFGSTGFGSTGGVRGHNHVDPYMIMRQGVIPGVSPSGSNIRAGVTNAGDRVHRSMPFQTAPLPPPPPPPAPPMPTATHGFGLPRRRRGWFSRMITPETVSEMHCEVVGPRADGLYVKICNGEVVAMMDAQGNVHHTGANDSFMGASGDVQILGFPGRGVRRFARRHAGWALGPAAGVGWEAAHHVRWR